MMAHCRPKASFTESSEKIFLAEWHFVTKLGPQVSPFPVPIFGVNKPFQGGTSGGNNFEAGTSTQYQDKQHNTEAYGGGQEDT
jgi:hypothetical protein